VTKVKERVGIHVVEDEARWMEARCVADLCLASALMEKLHQPIDILIVMFHVFFHVSVL
jgi:hypothetical protein